MRYTPEQEAQFNANRMRMKQIDGHFRIYMWANLFLGAVIFISAFAAGMLSTKQDEQEGPWIFYTAMSAGVFQILLGLATIVFGWMASGKKRIPSLILLGINVLGLLMVLLRENGTFNAGNAFFTIVGIALNIWAQFLCNHNEELKECEGYPHFVIEAAYAAQYELPENVRVRQEQASSAMETVGQQPEPASAKSAFAPAPDLFSDPAPVKLPPEVRLASEQALGISEMTDGQSISLAKPVQQPAAPVDASLESLTAAVPQAAAALPQVSAEAMLADMTAIPSHATMQGNPDLLPSPEEVRARMAAMKRAREEHRQEG